MNTELATLTGAYAVNALNDTERAALDRHLRVCPECAREVAELRETAARLGIDAATAPPAGLKDRVLAEVAHTRQQSPRARGASTRSSRERVLRGWGTKLAVAAAAVGVAMAGVAGGIAWQSRQELAQTQQLLRESGTRSAEMSDLLRAPDARVLRGSVRGAPVTTVLSHQHGEAMVLGTNLPTPPAHRVYQLWFIGTSGPTSGGLLPTASGRHPATRMAPMPADTRKMAITVEPAGGSPQPTSAPVLAMPT